VKPSVVHGEFRGEFRNSTAGRRRSCRIGVGVGHRLGVELGQLVRVVAVDGGGAVGIGQSGPVGTIASTISPQSLCEMCRFDPDFPLHNKSECEMCRCDPHFPELSVMAKRESHAA
jgi:hypothetical protein